MPKFRLFYTEPMNLSPEYICTESTIEKLKISAKLHSARHQTIPRDYTYLEDKGALFTEPECKIINGYNRRCNQKRIYIENY